MPSPTPVNRRQLLTLLGGSIAAPLLPDIAFAQEAWPTRTVRYVNGFPAGGATDTLSRILCQKMSELSGQSFVVENRAGAGGVLGGDAVAKSPPDGYTLGLGGIATNVLAIGTYAKLPYDPRDGFYLHRRHVAAAEYPLRQEGPRVLGPEGSARHLQEGARQIHLRLGGIRHHAASLRRDDEQHGRREVNHIPYKGAGPALTDLLGGRVDLLFDNLPGSLPSVRGGQIRPVAVTSRARIADLPDVPAMAEVLPGYEMTSWTAMVGPPDMKADLVAQINALTNKALADPGLKARYADLGASPMPTTPAEMKAFRASEEARLLPIMKAAGIKPS